MRNTGETRRRIRWWSGGIFLTALLLALFWPGNSPEADFSDLELTLPVAPERESFYRFLSEGKLAVDKAILKELAYVEYLEDDEADNKEWIAQMLDEMLPKIPEEFWKNLDRALAAPRGTLARSESIKAFHEQANHTLYSKEILRHQAWRIAQKGEPDAALRCAAKLWLLGRAWLDSSTALNSSYSALFFHQTGSRTVAEILALYPVSEECLRDLALSARNSRLTDEGLRNALRGYFREIHRWLAEISPTMRTDAAWFQWQPADFGKKSGLEPYVKKVIPWSWFYNEKATLQICADQTRLAIKSVGLSFSEARALTDKSEESAALKQRLDGRFGGDLVNLTGRKFVKNSLAAVPTLPYSQTPLPHLWIKAQTQQSLAETLLAVRRYELREGKLPENLEMLVPAYLDAVPLDYIDRQPIRYSAEKRAIWSVGDNMDNPIQDPLATWEATKEGQSLRNFIILLPAQKPSQTAPIPPAE